MLRVLSVHLCKGVVFVSLILQCCAISFVENLDAQSLSLTQEEYDSYMSGKATPPGSQFNQPICNGLKLMYANLASLEELRGRQDQLMKNARELQREMTAWKDCVVKQVRLEEVMDSIVGQKQLDTRKRKFNWNNFDTLLRVSTIDHVTFTTGVRISVINID